MRIDQMIRELQAQKRDLERAIELLESFERDGLERRGYKASSRPDIVQPQPGRRGRKFMTPTERRAVSERMKLYWSTRKHQDNKAAPPQSSAANTSKQSESRPGNLP